MALALDHFVVSFTLRDVTGKETELKYRLTAATATDAATSAQTLATRLAAITDSTIPAMSVNAVYKEAVGNGTGFGFNQAMITARLVTEGKTVNLRIPAAKAGIFRGDEGGDANAVDVNDADVIAFLSSFEAGAICSISDGEFLRDSATAGNWAGTRYSRTSKAAVINL